MNPQLCFETTAVKVSNYGGYYIMAQAPDGC